MTIENEAFRGWFAHIPSTDGYMPSTLPPINADTMILGSVYETPDGYLWKTIPALDELSRRRGHLTWKPAFVVAPTQMARGKQLHRALLGFGPVVVLLLVGALLAADADSSPLAWVLVAVAVFGGGIGWRGLRALEANLRRAVVLEGASDGNDR